MSACFCFYFGCFFLSQFALGIALFVCRSSWSAAFLSLPVLSVASFSALAFLRFSLIRLFSRTVFLGGFFFCFRFCGFSLASRSALSAAAFSFSLASRSALSVAAFSLLFLWLHVLLVRLFPELLFRLSFFFSFFGSLFSLFFSFWLLSQQLLFLLWLFLHLLG